MVGHIGYPVMDPEGRGPAHLRHAPITTAVALGDGVDRGIHRCEDSGIGIIHTEP